MRSSGKSSAFLAFYHLNVKDFVNKMHSIIYLPQRAVRIKHKVLSRVPGTKRALNKCYLKLVFMTILLGRRTIIYKIVPIFFF